MYISYIKQNNWQVILLIFVLFYISILTNKTNFFVTDIKALPMIMNLQLLPNFIYALMVNIRVTNILQMSQIHS